MTKTILIIEDNNAMRDVETEILIGAGYHVLEAGTAKEGIELALNNPVDLVLLDIRLPSKKRGIGTAKILRSKDATKDVHIIFVTGYHEGEYAKEVASISNHSYMTKPFDFGELLKKIKEKI